MFNFEGVKDDVVLQFWTSFSFAFGLKEEVATQRDHEYLALLFWFTVSQAGFDGIAWERLVLCLCPCFIPPLHINLIKAILNHSAGGNTVEREIDSRAGLVLLNRTILCCCRAVSRSVKYEGVVFVYQLSWQAGGVKTVSRNIHTAFKKKKKSPCGLRGTVMAV